MAYDEALAARIRAALEDQDAVTERKMFGGIAFMVGGNMACGVIRDDLMVRVGPDAHDAAVAEPHVRPMDFTGKPLKGFVYVSPLGFRTAQALRSWLTFGERVAEEMAVQRSEPRSRHRMNSTVGGRRTTSQARRSQRG